MKQIEICCGSYYDALQAQAGGAKRIELNSALHMGGLTPSLAALCKTKRDTKCKIMAMVRPRGAGFCYEEEDFQVMLEDARLLLEHGADGIVFGCLNEAGNLHIEQCQMMLDVIKHYRGEAVFHRAFDCVVDVDATMQALIQMGVDRVLTSGLAATAIQGKDTLKMLQTRYGSQIELLAGCGVNAQNAKELMQYTGIKQIHSSCKGWCVDNTTIGKAVNYSYATGEHASAYEVVEAKLVSALWDAVM